METSDLILVCFALPAEAGPFRRAARRRPRVRLLVTGMGPRNAEATLRTWLTRNRPAAVLTCGFAGGLDPALEHGAVVFEADQDFPHSAALLAAGARPGRFHCSPTIAVTAADKQRLRQETGADAVEMESGVIRAVCREHSVPSATVRAISDVARETLPVDFNRLAAPDWRLDYFKLAGAILGAPGKLGGLLRLQRQTRHAAVRLAAVLAAVTAG